jgi:magnesium chelatase subunit I
MKLATTLAELKRSGYRTKSVRDEVRANLKSRLAKRERIFKGLHGYDDTVVPQVVNALLSKHNFILLGLRGQAKTRILRSLVELLDETIPALAESDLNDDPFNPVSPLGKQVLAQQGDNALIRWIPRADRYIEKLATPDVTIADLLGDVDPLRAVKQGAVLSDLSALHFGLLPRANRGIFAMNELPDLAPKIQVGLFNILEEGDIQIKGFPLRLPLDLLLVFSANPQDYTARGKIIAPLKDRMGAEIRTHYPRSLEEAVAITEQESWTNRSELDSRAGSVSTLAVPAVIREVIEHILFHARSDRRIDQRAGVSQRLAITMLEAVVSNAERRNFGMEKQGSGVRLSDIYSALPAITGKLELEYEGEQIGAERIAEELIRLACLSSLRLHMKDIELGSVIEYFNSGNSLTIAEDLPDSEVLKSLEIIPSLLPSARSAQHGPENDAELIVYAELILEGLYAQRRVQRRSAGAGATFSKLKPAGNDRRRVVEDEEESGPQFN